MSYVGVGDVLWWLAVVAVGVLGGARLVRLVVHDDFPPTRAIRTWWAAKTSYVHEDGSVIEGSWTKVLTCHWCFAPYAMAAVFASAYFLDFNAVWWIGWGWAAASYLASMVVERDEKD